jgi:cold shock CspA family protein
VKGGARHLDGFFTDPAAMETPEMRDKGKLVSWNDEKGFGFIAPFSGAAQVFIHVKAFGNRNRRPEINDVVTYTLSSDKQGRPRAVNATLAGTRPPTRTERRSGTAAVARKPWRGRLVAVARAGREARPSERGHAAAVRRKRIRRRAASSVPVKLVFSVEAEFCSQQPLSSPNGHEDVVE